MSKGYCVRCKKMVEMSSPVVAEVKGIHGARRAMKGKCPNCSTKVCAFLKKK